MITVRIDPNVRVRGNLTYVGFEDADGVLRDGDRVRVTEDESGLMGFGVVVDVDARRKLAYLRVDWTSLRIPPRRTKPRVQYTCSAQPSEPRFIVGFGGSGAAIADYIVVGKHLTTAIHDKYTTGGFYETSVVNESYLGDVLVRLAIASSLGVSPAGDPDILGQFETDNLKAAVPRGGGSNESFAVAS